jgi:hypothetical protein
MQSDGRYVRVRPGKNEPETDAQDALLRRDLRQGMAAKRV